MLRRFKGSAKVAPPASDTSLKWLAWPEFLQVRGGARLGRGRGPAGAEPGPCSMMWCVCGGGRRRGPAITVGTSRGRRPGLARDGRGLPGAAPASAAAARCLHRAPAAGPFPAAPLFASSHLTPHTLDQPARHPLRERRWCSACGWSAQAGTRRAARAPARRWRPRCSATSCSPSWRACLTGSARCASSSWAPRWCRPRAGAAAGAPRVRCLLWRRSLLGRTSGGRAAGLGTHRSTGARLRVICAPRSSAASPHPRPHLTPTARWIIRHGPEHYKTGRVYGGRSCMLRCRLLSALMAASALPISLQGLSCAGRPGGGCNGSCWRRR
jgi:hypothetical protein